jgi:hypothetical protein
MGVNNAHKFIKNNGVDPNLLQWDVFIAAQTQPVCLGLMATFFWKIKVFHVKNDRDGLARYLVSRLKHPNLIVHTDGAQSEQKSATSMKRTRAKEKMLAKLEAFVTKVERISRLSKWVYKAMAKYKTSLYYISRDDLIYASNFASIFSWALVLFIEVADFCSDCARRYARLDLDVLVYK